MCGRYSLGCADVDELRARLGFDAFSDTRLQLRPRYNIAPGQSAVIVRSIDGRPTLLESEWGFARHKGGIAVNARVERAEHSPLFRRAYREGRCLVPADGFFEWRREGKVKQPYWFHRADGSLLLMAGLWEGDRFAVMTTDSSEVVSEIHDRMPVIVPSEQALVWLEGAKLESGVELTRRPVSTRVNRVEHDDAECVEPTDQQAFDFG